MSLADQAEKPESLVPSQGVGDASPAAAVDAITLQQTETDSAPRPAAASAATASDDEATGALQY